MIERIELKNFMSHDHTVIEPAKGLTVLVGPNNCGKSAVVAALQILCNNENSTYVMRHGSRECSVKIETDDGHVIQWRRKNAPSYVIDGQVYDRLRGSGLPDELHAVLRLSKVEAGDNTDFDVHFGTQKSPIFLLGGSAANAARFFASSSDAIRLVEMQKRHKERLAGALREKNRLEAEAKKVNAALGALEPVVDIEKRLAEAREDYEDLRRRGAWVLAAEQSDAALRAQSATVARHSAQADALARLPSPPELSPIEPLQTLIEALVAAEGRVQVATARSQALRSLPQPPTLAPTEPLRSLIAATESEQARRKAVESQSRVLLTLQAPPELRDVAVVERLIVDIVQVVERYSRAEGESQTLLRLDPPPPLADVEPLHHLVERLARCADELAGRGNTSQLLGCLSEPPPLADETTLAAALAGLLAAEQQWSYWKKTSAVVPSIAPVPATVDTAAISDLVVRLAESTAQVGKSEKAMQVADACLAEAAAELRSLADGNLCPICGSALDADRVIARATVALGGHSHG